MGCFHDSGKRQVIANYTIIIIRKDLRLSHKQESTSLSPFRTPASTRGSFS